MWCVAELNEEYIAGMEDVLETYERPYDPKQPVVCVDEKPIVTSLSPLRIVPDSSSRRWPSTWPLSIRKPTPSTW